QFPEIKGPPFQNLDNFLEKLLWAQTNLWICLSCSFIMRSDDRLNLCGNRTPPIFFVRLCLRAPVEFDRLRLEKQRGLTLGTNIRFEGSQKLAGGTARS